MYYFACVELVGLYLRTLGLEDKAAVIYSGDRVLEVSDEARWQKVSTRISFKEAKLILQERGVYVEFEEEAFKEAAEKWLTLLLKFSTTIQPISPASAFVDLSAHPQPDDIAAQMLHELYQQERLPIRAGIAPARWLAVLAKRYCEPDALKVGLLPVEPVRCPKEWLAPMRVGVLTPLPIQTRNRLVQLGLQFVREVQRMPDAALSQQFKKQAPLVRAVSEGRLTDCVTADWPKDSLAEELTLERCESSLELEHAILQLSLKAAKKLCDLDKVASRLDLYVQVESEQIFTGFRALKHPLQSTTELRGHLLQILQSFDLQEPVVRLRLFMSELKNSTRRQTSLAFTNERDPSLVESTLSRIKNAYGQASVIQGSQIQHSREQLVLKAWREAYGWK